MIRPCFLVVDREFPGSISTRKLVIETAKFNVITAYSGEECRQLLDRFPAIDGVVLDAALEDVPSAQIVREIKAKQSKLPVILIGAPGGNDCPEADFWLDSFQPSKLLEILRGLNPEATNTIEKRNEELSREK